MTELEALRRVAEAARKWRDWQARSFVAEGEYALYSDVSAALLALDALPAPAAEPEREVVAPLRAVSVAITQADSSGPWTRHVVMSDGSLWDQIGGQWVPVPLPRVPEVVGEDG